MKFLIEGEEEVGSEHLDEFLAANTEQARLRLRGDQRHQPVRPGPAGDHLRPAGHRLLRSASHGSESRLALRHVRRRRDQPGHRALPKCSAALIDAEGRIQIPGFYDDVVPLTDREREEFRRCRSTKTRSSKISASTASPAKTATRTLERRWARPTFDINGLTSGYQGEGAKTVLPAARQPSSASAWCPIRIPKKILAGLKQLLEPLVPPGLRMELIDFHGAPGIVIPLESPYLAAAADAIEIGFGTRPVFIREGGSIPIVNKFADRLAADVLALGLGAERRQHAQPERKVLARRLTTAASAQVPRSGKH